MDNFIRIYAAIQVVSEAVLPSLQNTLTQWHQQTAHGCCKSTKCKSKGKTKCKSKGKTKCKSKGRPVVGRSCHSCVQWGQAIEAAYYPQSNIKAIPWANINPTLLGIDFIQVAKAYALRLLQGNVYKDLGDFDAASLLMIMLHFQLFHQGDVMIPDKINKVGLLSYYFSTASLFFELGNLDCVSQTACKVA